MKLSVKSIILLITLVLIANITCKKDINKAPGKPKYPSPANNSTLKFIPLLLNWSCIDVDNDNLKYDIYFGTETPPLLLASDIVKSEYSDFTLESNASYYWKVIAKDDFGNITEGDIWTFTIENLPPETPANPIPENNSVIQVETITISWECIELEGETLTYDIYFGTDDDPDLLIQDYADYSYELPKLAGSQKYYWRIIAKDTYGNEVPGPLWNFTTTFFAPVLLFPEENSDTAPWFPKMKWTCNNAADLAYDLYFGTSSNPELLVSDLTNTSYHYLEQLEKEQSYYWKVVAKKEDGTTAESPVWSFTVFGDPIFGSFTDARDGNTYQTVTIGNQTWMAENLKYDVTGSRVYDDDTANEDIYGRLYTWEQIMNGEETSNENPSGVQGIAPEGWHIPSRSEWFVLINFIGGYGGNYMIFNCAEKLMEQGTEHWNIANGTNESGFTALGGGIYDTFNGYGYWAKGGLVCFHCSVDNVRFELWNSSGFLVYRRPSYISLRCVKNYTIEKNK